VTRQEHEKKARRNNILCTESHRVLPLWQHIDKLKTFDFVSQMLIAQEVGTADEDVCKVFRMGKTNPDCAARPTLLQLGSSGAKSKSGTGCTGSSRANEARAYEKTKLYINRMVIN